MKAGGPLACEPAKHRLHDPLTSQLLKRNFVPPLPAASIAHLAERDDNINPAHVIVPPMLPSVFQGFCVRGQSLHSSGMLKFADKDNQADFNGCAGGVRLGRLKRTGIFQVTLWLFQGEFP